MSKITVISFRCIAVTLLITSLLACNTETNIHSSVGINVHDANNLTLNHDEVVVLDVRTPKEFSKAHIHGALNINIHSPLFTQKVAELDRNKTYIVHCAVNPRGGRGDKSIHIMNELGFNKLWSLNGGLNAWKRADLPVNRT